MSIIGDYIKRLLTNVFPPLIIICSYFGVHLLLTIIRYGGVKLCQLIFLLQTSNCVSQGDSLGYLVY